MVRILLHLGVEGAAAAPIVRGSNIWGLGKLDHALGEEPSLRLFWVGGENTMGHVLPSFPLVFYIRQWRHFLKGLLTPPLAMTPHYTPWLPRNCYIAPL